MGDVNAKAAALCDEPGAAIGPVLAGPLAKGLLKCVAEGVCALNAGDGWIDGEVTADRTEASE